MYQKTKTCFFIAVLHIFSFAVNPFCNNTDLDLISSEKCFNLGNDMAFFTKGPVKKASFFPKFDSITLSSDTIIEIQRNELYKRIKAKNVYTCMHTFFKIDSLNEKTYIGKLNDEWDDFINNFFYNFQNYLDENTILIKDCQYKSIRYIDTTTIFKPKENPICDNINFDNFYSNGSCFLLGNNQFLGKYEHRPRYSNGEPLLLEGSVEWDVEHPLAIKQFKKNGIDLEINQYGKYKCSSYVFETEKFRQGYYDDIEDEDLNSLLVDIKKDFEYKLSNYFVIYMDCGYFYNKESQVDTNFALTNLQVKNELGVYEIAGRLLTLDMSVLNEDEFLENAGWIIYRPNGSIRFKGTYKEGGRCYNSNGKKGKKTRSAFYCK